MLKSPVYQPVRITSTDPFGANIAANNAVMIVSPIAKMYGSGVIRSNRYRKNEVRLESTVRRLVHRVISRRHTAVGQLADFQGANDEHI